MALTCPIDTSKLSLEQFNCSLLHKNCSCPPLQPDQDVAGLGVIIAFMFSTLLTLVASCAFFIITHWGKIKGLFPGPQKYVQIGMTREHYLRDLGNFQLKHRPGAWKSCLQSIVTGLSDQALATGLSISISSLAVYPKGSIDKYHFCIASSLACLANGVHILSIILVRTDKKGEASSKINRIYSVSFGQGQHVQMAIWAWRRLCMLASLAMFCAMFVIHLGPDKTDLRRNQATCPAKCSFTMEGGPSVFQIILPVLLFVFTIISVVLVDGKNNSFVPNVLDYLPAWIQKRIHAVGLAIFIFCMYFSLGLWILFGFPIPNSIRGHTDWANETRWSFGQIVSLVLLMLPIMSAAEAYHDSFSESSPEIQPGNSESYQMGKHPPGDSSKTLLVSQSNQTPPDSSSFNFEPYRSVKSNISSPDVTHEIQPAGAGRESQSPILGSQAHDPLGIVEYNEPQSPQGTGK